MTLSFYDATVDTYLRIGRATASVLDKGAEHFTAQGKSLDELAGARLIADMADLRFQINSVVHHSLGAVRAYESGEFGPPKSIGTPDYAGLQALLASALGELEKLDRAHVESLADGNVTFRMGEMALPFTATNFALSFSLPNFYFHATTAYDILRSAGVPLSKMDFVGQMRMSV